jgi:hypothetical protein
VVTIQWLRTPEVHGNAMLNDTVLVEDLIEDLEGAAAIDHVVFRDDLEPIDHRLLVENVVVVRNS